MVAFFGKQGYLYEAKTTICLGKPKGLQETRRIDNNYDYFRQKLVTGKITRLKDIFTDCDSVLTNYEFSCTRKDIIDKQLMFINLVMTLDGQKRVHIE